MKVAIIGLGYVGLPLACVCSKVHETIGIDTDERKIGLINKGVSPIKDPFLEVEMGKSKIHAFSDFSKIKECDAVVVCVPTPVDEDHQPDLSPVKNACKGIAPYFKEGALIVIESTIYPGTCEEEVKPLLDVSGKKYFLAHCPERVDPGNKKWNVGNLPRVVGALDKEGLAKAGAFYRSVVSGTVTELSSIRAAESVKIMENTFRDINIAFMNEMAKSFDSFGIDISEVIKGASTKPFAFMPHYPGRGVGGHCIAVDPYYLITRAQKQGFSHDFLRLARSINNSMPEYTVQMMIDSLNSIEKSLKGAKIGLLGLAYKKNIDDNRESPAYHVLEGLLKRGANVKTYDPYVKSDCKDLDALLTFADYLVLCTDHDEFTSMDLSLLKKKGIKIIVDGRNCLDAAKVRSLGIVYKGIGK